MTTPSRALAVRDNRPSSLSDKLQYAMALADAGLLPSEYRKQPANVLYAMEYGETLGISTIAAVIGVHVIEGKPGASPALMSALVRRAGHRLRVWLDREAMTAYAELVRADDPEFTFRAEWDLGRAVTAELCTIKNGKPYARSKDGKLLSWEKYPGNMLKWRCVSEVCRDGAEECLMGMHYTPEELGAEVDAEGEPLRVMAERVAEPRSAPVPDPAPAEPVRVSAERVARPPVAERTPPAPTSPHEEPASTPAAGVYQDDDGVTDWGAAITECRENKDLAAGLDGLRDLWYAAKQKAKASPSPADEPRRMAIEAAMRELKQRIDAQPTQAEPDSPAETPEVLAERKTRDELRAELFALLGKGGVKGEEMKPERLRICSRLTVPNRVPEITSTNELSDLEVAQVIVALRRYDREGTLAETLAAMSGTGE